MESTCRSGPGLLEGAVLVKSIARFGQDETISKALAAAIPSCERECEVLAHS
jgi:hypothetical protein